MPDQQAGDKKKERFAAVGAMLLFTILFFASAFYWSVFPNSTLPAQFSQIFTYVLIILGILNIVDSIGIILLKKVAMYFGYVLLVASFVMTLNIISLALMVFGIWGLYASRNEFE